MPDREPAGRAAAPGPSPLRGQADSELLSAYARTRGADVMAEILRRHTPLVMGTCLCLLGDQHVAEDAAQTVFLVFCRKAPNLPPGTVLRGWLYAVARLTALQMRRDRAFQIRHERRAAMNRPRPATEQTEASWETFAPAVDDALSRLAPKFRDAVLLHHVGGLSQNETASELGCSVSAASMRIVRGLEQLRKHMTRRGVVVSSSVLAGLLRRAEACGVQDPFLRQTLALCQEEAPAAGAMTALSGRVESILFWMKVKGAATWGAAGLLAAGTLGAVLLATGAWVVNPNAPPPARTAIRTADVCVYAATPGGILAAVAASREGLRAVVVEPSRWVGGLLGAGVKPAQDCPNRKAVGGLTRRVFAEAGDAPAPIRAYFARLLAEHRIPLVVEHRVAAVEKDGPRIRRLRLEKAPPDRWGCPAASAEPGPGIAVEAIVFIDASYEGDVMARAGVSYAVGREPASRYHESLAGMRPWTHWTPIDPFVKPGNPASGFLPMVEADPGKAPGDADDGTQAYNFRFYVTTDPRKRAPFTRPGDYDPKQFELAGRYAEHLALQGEALDGIFPGLKNSGEYNYARGSLVSIAPVGLTRSYADGDYAARAGVWRAHIDYLRGLHCFMSTDPRVPPAWRERVAAMGLDRSHHPDTDGWPHQLYIRSARRLIGRTVLTQSDVAGTAAATEDSIGLAQHVIDSYPVRRMVATDPATGRIGVATEGAVSQAPPERADRVPFPIPYRAITPRAEECVNLLVPVCLSASAVARDAVRMEPVFMVLGESAGIAAAQAIGEKADVQAIDATRLRERLRKAGQVLAWPPGGAGIK